MASMHVMMVRCLWVILLSAANESDATLVRTCEASEFEQAHQPSKIPRVCTLDACCSSAVRASVVVRCLRNQSCRTSFWLSPVALSGCTACATVKKRRRMLQLIALPLRPFTLCIKLKSARLLACYRWSFDVLVTLKPDAPIVRSNANASTMPSTYMAIGGVTGTLQELPACPPETLGHRV